MTEPTHYVLPRGKNSMVKEAEFFRSQSGHVQEWGKSWLPVVVDNKPRYPQNEYTNPDVCAIENARSLASHLPPVRGWTERRELPFVNVREAMDINAEIRQRIKV